MILVAIIGVRNQKVQELASTQLSTNQTTLHRIEQNTDDPTPPSYVKLHDFYPVRDSRAGIEFLKPGKKTGFNIRFDVVGNVSTNSEVGAATAVADRPSKTKNDEVFSAFLAQASSRMAAESPNSFVGSQTTLRFS